MCCSLFSWGCVFVARADACTGGVWTQTGVAIPVRVRPDAMGDCHADPIECVHSAGETSSVVIVMRLGRRARREPPLHARQRPKRVLPRLRRPRGGRPGAAGAFGCASRSRAAVRGAPELQRRGGGGGGARGCRPARVAHRARDGLMDGGRSLCAAAGRARVVAAGVVVL